MRFGFVTCVQLGLSCMEAIYEVGGRLDVALTLEDDMARGKSGRVYLDAFCADQAIDLVKVRNINLPAAIEAITSRQIDWLFIIGWSQIARADVLAAPKHGVLGMHPTLLPVGRGRAAIPWAILKGLPETGVTLFKLDDGVDTGPIVSQIAIPLQSSVDATWLYARVDEAHTTLMRESFRKLERGTVSLQKQDDAHATEWPGRKPEDGLIDRLGSVRDAERLVRAVTRPYPGAFADIDGERLTIWRAEIVKEASAARGPVIVFADGLLHCLEWEKAALPEAQTI